jgi:hypothetical protein
MAKALVLMRVHRTLLALSLIAAPPACTATQDESPVPKQPLPAPAPAQAGNPMASFARLVGGEWRFAGASGASPFHAWHWGPGDFSMRKMTYWSDAAANPWAGEVLYWHPGLRQVCLLSMHGDIPAVGRGVAEGTIRFDGETTTAAIDLDQPRGRRMLGQRQIFEGADKYHEILLEDTGAGLQPLAEWDFVRVEEGSGAPPPTDEQASLELPAPWKPFEALMGSTWEADGVSATGKAFRIHSTYEWVPSLEAVFARAYLLDGEGEGTPLLDAYIYRTVRTNALRCLALSSRGGVYEGDLTVLDGGALQLDLRVYEGDRAVPQVARFDLEHDGRLRTRVWSLDGAVRTLTLDVEHEKLPK